MQKNKLKKFGFKLVLLAVLALPELAGAQLFKYNATGDLLAGFRKPLDSAALYELVVDLGSVTNFVNLPVGTTVTITNFTPTELTNAFTDTGGFQYLQWSAFAAFPSSSWVTPLGTFPGATLWFTLPGTNVNTQTRPPALNYKGEQSDVKLLISGVGSEAVNIAGFLGGAGTNNNSVLVREPTSYDSSDDTLSFFIQDTTVVNGITVGDFGESGSPLPFVVENTTPSPFAAAQRSDFYESVPYGDQDPVSGLTSTNADRKSVV